MNFIICAYMASLDIAILFLNIPIAETINIYTDNLKHENNEVYNMDHMIFKIILS